MVAPAIVGLSEEALKDLCSRYQIREIYLFGSAARNEMQSDSDLDVLVDFKPGHTMDLFDFGHLQDELANLTGKPVDLVSKSGLNPRIAPHILRDARLLYAS